MPPTSTSFAAPSDVLARFDQRVIGDLVEDLGLNVSTPALLSDPNLQTVLNDASGEIVAACITNGHYTTANLFALASSGLPSGSLLIRLTCALALSWLLGRRFYNEDEISKKIPDNKWAFERLEMLKNGQRVFELPAANAQSGVMAVATLGQGGGSNGTTPCLISSNQRCFGVTPVNRNRQGNCC